MHTPKNERNPLGADPTNGPSDRQRNCPGGLRNGDLLADRITDIRTDRSTDVRTDAVTDVLIGTDRRFDCWVTLADAGTHSIRTTFRRVWWQPDSRRDRRQRERCAHAGKRNDHGSNALGAHLRG